MVELKKEKRFHFAISFSGSNREIASQLKDKLAALGFSVFYDRDYEHEMLGKDGTSYFRRIYTDQSQFCLVLVSEDYDEGKWTILERQFIQDREFSNQEEAMIAVMTSSHRPPWLRPTRIFFDLEQRSLDELVSILKKKVPLEKQVSENTLGILDYKAIGEDALTGINNIYSKLSQTVIGLKEMVNDAEMIQTAFSSSTTTKLLESLSVFAESLSHVGKAIKPDELSTFVKQVSISYPMYFHLSDFKLSQAARTNLLETLNLITSSVYPLTKGLEKIGEQSKQLANFSEISAEAARLFENNLSGFLEASAEFETFCSDTKKILINQSSI